MKHRIAVCVAALAGIAPKAPAQQPAAAAAAAGESTRALRDSVRDPNTSRLFFAPTGRTPRAGTAYIGDIQLFFPTVGAGITDRVGFAAGVSIFPGASSQLLYVAPKIGVVRSRQVNVAVGGIYVTVPGQSGYAAGGYAAATVGEENTAATLVVGYPIANGVRALEPMILGGAEVRISPDIKFLAEAWKLPGTDVAPVIVGFRFLGRRSAFDFGMMRWIGVDMEGFPFIPWLGFSIGIT